ncbi:MAG: hypothetical protein M1484_00120 [Patescibacteria group bacterium]|nr:hypothetical protein [Patescibacteria group bacterium]MCL5431486.1 hypothetical protein [Patescibacteria group bacterium]
MPKKTKKEKIMAQYHRKLQQISYKIPEQKTPTVIVAVPSFQSPVSSHSDYSYVLSDLKRIAILTALAICAQVVLWYRYH